MLIKIEMKILDKIMPFAGASRLFNFPKSAGNKPSFAAAKGICPCIKIQPFNAPKVEITAPAATQYLAESPHKTAAASANGAFEFAKVSGGIIPKTAVEPKM